MKKLNPYFGYRIAISTMFFTSGVVFASWASRIPAIQKKLGISDGELGLVLLAGPVGSLLSLPVAGWLTTRFQSKNITQVSAIVCCFILSFLALAPNPFLLALALFCYGSAGDILNIAMNTQAVAVEIAYKKPIMSSFHGIFSLGGMFGAFLGGLSAEFLPNVISHFAIISGTFILISTYFSFKLLPIPIEKKEKQALFVRPDASLWGLGFIAFCVMLGEGAMADWSSVYLKQNLPESEAGLAVVGYTVFSLAMAVGRFWGDWLAKHLGAVKMLQISGILSAVGMALALFTSHFYLIIFGFTCVGAGFATVVPLVYGAAGRSKTMSAGMALAGVSTVGYLGFLFGPPCIGFISEYFSLKIALISVLVLSAMISFLSFYLKNEND
ncbi:MAG: MFS transporter [Bacteroidetes bacterium]|nr:MAG: MFS transporter [Bacteroidota bacterium]